MTFASASPETPDQGVPRRRQLGLLGGRLFVATLLLGGSLFLGDAGELGEFTRDALMILIAATFTTALAVAVSLPRVRRPAILVWLQIGWDLGVITGLVYLLGGAESGFSFLYGVVILAAALTLGSRATQITTAAALVLYLFVGLALANAWIPPPPGQHASRYGLPLDLVLDDLVLAVLRNLVGFTMIGLLAGSLADRLRKTGSQLEEATVSARGLARLNEDILRSLASGLITTDLEGRIVRVNRAGAALLGAEPSELVGRSIATLFPVPSGAPLDVERGEGFGTRVDGRRFPVGFTGSPLRDAEDRVLGSLLLFSDLTELNQLREQAERAERLAALGRLAAGLAHEIRNPLGSISGSVELVLEAAELAEEDRRLLTLVLSEVDRLDDLLTTMLDVGRPREPELAPADLGVLATDVAKVASREGPPPVVVRAPAEAVRLRADPRQLRQVLWNLVKNARQLSPPGSEVRVEVGWDGDARATLSVSDEGPGIAEEDRDRLFDMFFSKRRHGVGLGLALVHQIVEAHGGEIRVTSEPGAGATFTVHLPVDGPSPEQGRTVGSAREDGAVTSSETTRPADAGRCDNDGTSDPEVARYMSRRVHESVDERRCRRKKV